MGISERIKIVRDYYKLSQSDFAKKLGVAQNVISRYERGEVKPASDFITVLIQICTVNSNWLLTGDGEMFLYNSKKESENFQSASDASIIKSKNIAINEIVRVLETMPDQKIQECLGLCQEKKLLYDLLQERLKKSVG